MPTTAFDIVRETCAPGPAGLLALGLASVTVDGAGATEQRPTEVSENVGNGIEVRGQAHVDVAGATSRQNFGAGTVVAKNNSLAGMYVEQLLVSQGASGLTGLTVTESASLPMMVDAGVCHRSRP